MTLNDISGWASLVSLLLGVISIFLSTYSIKKVNNFIVKSKDVNRNKVKINGNNSKASGRDFYDK
jgi:hypothetical protein